MAEETTNNSTVLSQVSNTWKSMTRERQMAFGGVA